MLDPRRSVDYAARFLVRLYARHEKWSMAVARHHAGPDNDPAQKRYICRVIANMVDSERPDVLQLLDVHRPEASAAEILAAKTPCISFERSLQGLGGHNPGDSRLPIK